ncbi:MAG TPA: helix-hairpin-helix domain-containing protein [Longimicrobiales bacterium]|nr:helix-hairpin-helix domain-containing protein [Longimicrobiales bacterium]
MSTDERRALAIILALIMLAAAARWLERPRPILENVAPLDVQRLEQESRAAQDMSGTRAPRSGSAGSRDRPAAGSATALDLNTATAAQIEALPGIGPTVAARIIDQRQRAPFRYVSDLRNVRGIGPTLAARLAPLVLLSADPPPSPPSTGRTEPAGTGTAPVQPAGTATAHDAAIIDLNSASAAELEQLPGVGPVIAARLIARRQQLGPFRSWDAVDSVSGIGPALLARLMRHARLQP